jgi:ABC-type spermidine/putrescine transport system permease subunit I
MSHAAIFLRVAVPLSRGGAAAGVITVFALATGAYVTVAMFGPHRVQTLARLAYDQSQRLIGWQIGALLLGLGGIGVLVAARWARAQAAGQRRPNSRPAASSTSA